MPASNAKTASRSGKTNSKTEKLRSQASIGSDLVGKIYKAAFYPEAWAAVLSETAELLGSVSVFIVLHDERSKSKRVYRAYGIDAAFGAALEVKLAQDAHWLNLVESASGQEGTVLYGDHLLRQSASGMPSLFQEFLRQQDIGPMLYACLGVAGQRRLHFIVARPAAGAVYTEYDRKLCQSVVDQIGEAWQLEHKVAEDSLAERCAMEALNRMGVGVAIVDSRGEIRATNDAGQTMLSKGDGLSPDLGQIEVRVDRVRGSLRTVLGRLEWCRQTPGSECSKLFAVERPSRRRPYSILVRPFRPDIDVQLGETLYYLAFIFDPDRPLSGYSVEFLKQHFELTPAEARLAKLIAEGERLDSIADRLGISVHTARTHLKRVFEKTGVERQAELVQLMFGCLGLMQDSVGALAGPSPSAAASVDSPAA